MIRPLVPLKTPGLCRLQRRCDRYRWRHLVRCRRGYTAALGYPHTLLQHQRLRTNSLLDILRNVFLELQCIVDGWINIVFAFNFLNKHKLESTNRLHANFHHNHKIKKFGHFA